MKLLNVIINVNHESFKPMEGLKEISVGAGVWQLVPFIIYLKPRWKKSGVIFLEQISCRYSRQRKNKKTGTTKNEEGLRFGASFFVLWARVRARTINPKLKEKVAGREIIC